MMSAEGLFTSKKERFITAHSRQSVKCPRHWQGWLYMRICLMGQEKKSPLSASKGIRIKRVHFKENARTFARNKENCP